MAMPPGCAGRRKSSELMGSLCLRPSRISSALAGLALAAAMIPAARGGEDAGKRHEAAPSRKLQAGDWVEYRISLPKVSAAEMGQALPPNVSLDVRKKPKAKPRGDHKEKPATAKAPPPPPPRQTFNCRLTVSAAEGNHLDISLQIQLGKEPPPGTRAGADKMKAGQSPGSISVKRKGFDISSFFDPTAGRPPPAGTVAGQADFYVRGKTLSVRTFSWRQEKGASARIERWESRAIPFGLARLRTDRLELLVVAYGRAKQEPPPPFPIPAGSVKRGPPAAGGTGSLLPVRGTSTASTGPELPVALGAAGTAKKK